MAAPTPDAAANGLLQKAKTYGESSVPPALIATLATSLHLRPFQPLPMLFPPVFLFSSYLNLQGFVKDSAGFSAAWSALYFVLASRRKPAQGFRGKFTARGAVRGFTMGMCAVQVAAGGLAYAFSKRELKPLLKEKK